MAIAYALFGVAGVLSFFVPSPSLENQGGLLVLHAWGVVCIAASVIALVGVFREVRVARLLGAALCAAASLVWFVALILQTVSSGNLAALTAACLVGALVALLVQRWSDVGHPPEE